MVLTVMLCFRYVAEAEMSFEILTSSLNTLHILMEESVCAYILLGLLNYDHAISKKEKVARYQTLICGSLWCQIYFLLAFQAFVSH